MQKLPADDDQEEMDPYAQQQMDEMDGDEEEDYGQQQLDVNQDDDEEEDGDEVVDQVAETIPVGGGVNLGAANNNPYNQMNNSSQNQNKVYHQLGANQNGFGNVQMNPNFQFPGGPQQNRQQFNPQLQQQQLQGDPLQGPMGGRMRPQSAKVSDNQQLKFQQQLQQQQLQMQQQQYMYGQQQPQWVGQGQMGVLQQQNYMSNDPNIIAAYQMQQQQQQNLNPNTTAGFMTNGFYGGIPLGGNAKKRPTTASRKGGPSLGFGGQKKSFPNKNPSSLDLEVSKLRPKIINQERERLYDDALKQKMTANFLKDENMRLKTKLHKLESELTQKEKLVDDLLQQESYSAGMGAGSDGRPPMASSKVKLEGHLAQNLKRKIKELQVLLAQKHEESEVLKRNIKSTKTAELEVEIKMFSDECVRLRHQLEEVIKSKDTFADPEELKIIEAKFAQQDAIISQLRSENSELANVYTKKEDENRQLREMFTEMEKKTKKVISNAKEQAKLRKTIKTQEKEVRKLQSEVNAQKSLNDDYRAKIEEMIKKGPLNQSQQNSSYQQPNINNNKAVAGGPNEARLRQEIQEKDAKIQEVNTVVQQLQGKLQEKINEVQREQSEKDKFKKLYEQYQDQVVSLQGQLEDAGIKIKQVVQRPTTASNRPKSAYRPSGVTGDQGNNNQSLDSKQNQSKQAIPKGANKAESDEDDNYSDDDPDNSKQTQKKNTNDSLSQAKVQAQNAAPKAPQGRMTAPVDEKQAKEVALEMKLKLQSKGFFYHQINEFFFKPYQKESLVLVKQLVDMLETNGLSEKRSRLLARYIVEPKEQSKVLESDENSCSQFEVVKTMSQLIGPYKLFNDAAQVKRYTETLMKLFSKCKSTLKDTLQLEDYEDDGTVPVSAFKEAFDTLDVKIDKDTFDYLVYAVYQRSQSLEKMNYQVLLDLIEGKVVQGGLSVGSNEGGARKRPESSSPEKLKARNKEKFSGISGAGSGSAAAQSQPTEQSKKALKNNGKNGSDEDGDDDNYEEEFDKLLDKDDEEEPSNKKIGQVGNKLNQKTDEDENDDEYDDDPDIQHNKAKDADAAGGMDEDEDDYIDEDQMLDVAEKCFMKIAEAIIQSGISVRRAFSNFIIKEQIETDDGESQAIELLSPMGFLEGIKDLGVTDLEEVEVACLMRVLTKADLENAILLRELIVIMENFGIQDDEDEQSIQMLMGGGDKQKTDAAGVADQYGSQDLDDMDGNGAASNTDLNEVDGRKKKKKSGSSKAPLDLSVLDEKSIKIMAKLILALMELKMELEEFFDGVIYEQLVKSKKKQNKVQIINTKDFYAMLQKRGVRKSEKEHESLTKFLQLDPNYPNLLMFKKIDKTINEMYNNEELMAGIFAAAQDDMMGGANMNDDDQQPPYNQNLMKGDDDDYDDDDAAPQQPQQQKKRLNTIGEEDHDAEFKAGAAKNNTKMAAAATVKGGAPQDNGDEENYDDDEEYDENNGNDDYEF